MIHYATAGILTECARHIRRSILLTKRLIWVYEGTKSDIHVTPVEEPSAEGRLIGCYNEHASVAEIAEDLIHHARSKGVHLEEGA